MAHRYIISDYEKAEDKTPRINFRTGDLKKAEACFTKSAKRKVRSVVLYNAGTDTVLKLAIDGEPIYLVEAIEKARGEMEHEALASAAAKEAAEIAIRKMVEALSGEAVPGVGGTIFAHFLHPNFAIKGDRAAAAGASALVGPLTPPRQKCTICNGTGLVDDFRRCNICNGKGFLQ